MTELNTTLRDTAQGATRTIQAFFLPQDPTNLQFNYKFVQPMVIQDVSIVVEVLGISSLSCLKGLDRCTRVEGPIEHAALRPWLDNPDMVKYIF